ncbi:MAG: hypothetical protein A2X71_08860 [Thiobacillus sp. GWE1_62_9]|nr:MAG: hypothetical protein A2X71_08860 [Thiobacillus sp. GWE1_62_9]
MGRAVRASEDDGDAVDDAGAALGQFDRPGRHRTLLPHQPQHRIALGRRFHIAQAQRLPIAGQRIDVTNHIVGCQRHAANRRLKANQRSRDLRQIVLGKNRFGQHEGRQAQAQRERGIQLRFQPRPRRPGFGLQHRAFSLPAPRLIQPDKGLQQQPDRAGHQDPRRQRQTAQTIGRAGALHA